MKKGKWLAGIAGRRSSWLAATLLGGLLNSAGYAQGTAGGSRTEGGSEGAIAGTSTATGEYATLLSAFREREDDSERLTRPEPGDGRELGDRWKPADQRLRGVWSGIAVDKPGDGTSRDSLELDLELKEGGGLAGCARGAFVDDRETELRNVRVNGGWFEAEVPHRTGVIMRMSLRLERGILVGDGIPVLAEENSCDIKLVGARVQEDAYQGKRVRSSPFGGKWVGLAVDKPEDGSSRDPLTLVLWQENGQLEGEASGRFVLGGRAPLQQVRVAGERLEAELPHRTGVSMRIMVRVEGRTLRGEAVPVLTDGDRCDLELEFADGIDDIDLPRTGDWRGGWRKGQPDRKLHDLAAPLVKDAWRTADREASATRSLVDGRRIPEEYWGGELRKLKPAKVYRHRGNLVVVQEIEGDLERGLYLYLPISSYWPKDGDDGFRFRQLSDGVHAYVRRSAEETLLGDLDLGRSDR